MDSREVAELKLSACCISHEFLKAASKSPDKIAVIHASGFARLACDRRRNGTADQPLVYDTMKGTTPSSHPPVYYGDECFTFSEILSAVENISFRLRRILDGADDPHLIKPSRVHSPSKKSGYFSGLLQCSSLSVQQCTKFGNVRTPKIVAIYMEPSVEYIVSVLSVMRCGEAFMPLDPTWPKARLLSILASSKADLVIGYKLSSEESSCHRLDMLQWLVDNGSCSILPISMKDNIEEKFPLVQLECPCEHKTLRSFCYLMYTSGSSGQPKGVCGTEVGLLNRFLWKKELYPLHDADLVLFKTPISFVDHLQEFLEPVLTTCTLVIPPFNQIKENIIYLIDFLQGYLISRLVAVPSLMRAILPALESPFLAIIQDYLKLLVLSGEILQLSLCKMLLTLLPQTSILNLYGSTEVTGDCTYFDCKRLALILEHEELESVPIGMPISNCDVVLVGEDTPNQGEILVYGLCVAAGYFQYPHLMPFTDSVSPLRQNLYSNQPYFKTGDFARKLQTGDLVFLGRKDRLLKLNGQRIALEEIENALKDHSDVIDAAVVSREVDLEILLLEAFLVTGKRDEDNEVLKSSIKSWLQRKLPQAMIPTLIHFASSLPLTSSGKVDYLSLAASAHSYKQERINLEDIPQNNLIQVIIKVFSDALMVKKVSFDDDFFKMGGNSITAAYVSFKLGIHMRLLYAFPTPLRLQRALSSSISSSSSNTLGVDLTEESRALGFHGSKPRGRLFNGDNDRDIYNAAKRLKTTSTSIDSEEKSPRDTSWNPALVHTKCSFGRCNKSMHGGQCAENCLSDTVSSSVMPRDGKGYMEVLWKVNLNSCVDASPLVVSQGSDIYVFIGSHSHEFVCIDAQSGVVQWETKLEGRVECSAAILDDFSQVVVGCYQGNIYFLHILNGSVCWKFRTNGEVKSQPVVDKCRNLVWCGSYDQNLYAIDYRSYCCIYKLSCGGSIFGSPAIDEMQGRLFVASTSGHMTSISIEAMPFKELWRQDLGAPVFGSLSIDCSNGNIICCLVDGTVRVLSTCGSTVWKAKTGGPNFAGPCISSLLPSEVLICSRDGNLYSFEMKTGTLLWKHAIGRPITSSPYVDENSHLIANISQLSHRLICVCNSSGSIYVLKVGSNANGGLQQNMKQFVEECAQLELQGDIFSSPVMIGGRIFVGCRDDHVYCIKLNVELT